MKRITYAGESVLTSDEVATALVELTAALAQRGLAEAVVIPIMTHDSSAGRTAELVVGMGNDVLAVPEDHDGDEPDFAAEARALQEQTASVTPRRSIAVPGDASEDADVYSDLDLGLGETGELKPL